MTTTRPDIQRTSAAFDMAIGITERVTTPATLWHGIMRHRRTDFLVNEIQKDGTVLHLTNSNIQAPKDKNVTAQPAPAPANDGPEKPDIPQEDVEALAALTSPAFAESVVRLYKTGNANPEGSKPFSSATSPLIEDKSKRSQVHQEVRRIFNSEIDTSTDPSGAIVAKKGRNPRSRNRNAAARRRIDCTGEGEFLHFTLFKENRDTLEAVNLISRLLSLRARSVHFAGTKDRRAATVQRCSVRLRTASDLAKLNSKLYGVKTGDYEYKHEAIRLGQLRGNEFTIVAKDCRLPGDADLTVPQRVQKLQDSLDAVMKQMNASGWINYFGHQRFGSYATGTNKIGMLILSGKLEEAVNALLEYDPRVLESPPDDDTPRSSPRHDEYNRAKACQVFATEGDGPKALKYLPSRFAAETTLISHLSRVGSSRDFAGALLHLPRGLRTLYLHAYQSFVWNHAASRRWALYGATVVEGDIVADEKPAPVVAQGGDGEEEEEADPDEGAISPRVLTKEEAESGKYTIDDVFLPTAGTDTILPGNEVGAFYREFMMRPENGSMDPSDLPRPHKEFTAPGRYRRLIARFLSAPSVEVRRYVSDDEQMWPTDLDILEKAAKERDEAELAARGKRAREEAEAGPSKRAKVEGEAEQGNQATVGAGVIEESGESADKTPVVEAAPGGAEKAEAEVKEAEGEKVAAILHFQLGRSAYATVAIREMGLAPEVEGVVEPKVAE
ncbi:related to pseudouridine synthase TruD/Pus7 [Cephalotrichum gorgonifer]|uniref:Related to pseudouridine synthase TruD/Pus7 n=1 Tax=Cephalotrichum gorgonifer TaxID=2041049 RepID=A0AAE8N2Y1_9PEZI|nr:related to pseudouridine synthase TruD/Pus7 [Cephalotrichum gorgonifer]